MSQTIHNRPGLNAVGTTEGVSRYLERLGIFPAGTAAETMREVRPGWLNNIDACSAISELPLAEIEPYWPRTFQVFHEQLTAEHVTSRRAEWERDLTEERGMWITAALLREPAMRFTGEYVTSAAAVIQAAQRFAPPLLTWRAAARLLLNAGVWNAVSHLRERPYEIAELLSLAESDVRAQHFRRSRGHVKRLPQKNGVIDSDKLYEMLLNSIWGRLS